MTGLKDKVVIITGASSGIGAQTAVEFAKLGSRVVLTARRTEKLKQTATRCCQTGLDRNKVHLVTADVMKDADLQRIVDSTLQVFGGIDVLVNNAGSAVHANTLTATVDDLDRMYRMHTRAVFILIKLALPHIIKGKGNIVNVSSIASQRPLAYVLPYAVAKHAQDHMMKAMALDLGPMGVRLNSICPGSILTEIFTNSGYVGENNLQQILTEHAAIHPLKRLGTVEEAAKAILFLASDDASYISGVTLPVDAGRANTSALPRSKL